MSQVRTAVTRLTQQLQAQLPGVPVFAVPPGETTPPREAVWVDAVRSSWSWRSLGGNRNRDEQVEVTVRVHVWREAPDAMQAGEDARGRCLELIDLIDQAVAADQSLNGLCGAARVSDARVELHPEEHGWSCAGLVTVTADLIPSL